MILNERSVDIGCNVRVSFEGVTLRRGKSAKGVQWTALEIRFRQGDRKLRQFCFEPRFDDYMETRNFAIILKELLDVLTGKPLWDKIPKSRLSWNTFYEHYLEAIKDCRGTVCYIKTLGKHSWDDKELGEAILAPQGFISMTDNLKYTLLEENMVEDFLEEEVDEGAIDNHLRKIDF